MYPYLNKYEEVSFYLIRLKERPDAAGLSTLSLTC